jgi:hypothetical protein
LQEVGCVSTYSHSPGAQAVPNRVIDTERSKVQLLILPMFTYGLLTPSI